jgi:TRAP-type mannitol/chloroaromatic compound transport system substrate-binding protein
MKRRDFMTKAGVAAGAGVVAASTLSTPALAAKKVELNIVSTWGRDFQDWEQELKDLLKECKRYQVVR